MLILPKEPLSELCPQITTLQPTLDRPPGIARVYLSAVYQVVDVRPVFLQPSRMSVVQLSRSKLPALTVSIPGKPSGSGAAAADAALSRLAKLGERDLRNECSRTSRPLFLSGALLAFDMLSPSSGDAGTHSKSMQERTCRRGRIEFGIFSRLEYSIFVNSWLGICNA